ncbi:phosphoenolpyruvate carboxykinase (ATP) [Lichenicola cladoniae]|uniref:Phosphoenolpyruvate carboxykinase (ATP) n=2 Tax=Lichenicola cladoniae TaxID=1484109 RepID=A0A6M8HW75_9PROT|nr:phosphoenolpyruvate carboxykinase (ATP) [Acetobacteraceae bacterium]QKE92425.1 phosphoenolpyruvate carboxykinase (ATP) [Lichenicola cladoniae]
MLDTPDVATWSADALDGTGLHAARHIYANEKPARLTALALQRGEVTLSEDGAIVANTGEHTGRSVQDKFVVDEAATTDAVWWGKVNNRLSEGNFSRLCATVRGYLQGQVLFTQDLFAGADPAHRIRVRLVTTNAWHALFARNMFIRPEPSALEDFAPDYVILHAPDLAIDPASCGVRSSTVIALSFAQKLVVIAGTQYAGEIKKSIFTVMNWLLPEKGLLPMHCSANVGKAGDVALFFGLSGTGKTTLSSDPSRDLIGDDEHGWSPHGVFNFEGGCYAKVIGLQREAEPEIWQASHRFGAVLENVVADDHGTLDLGDKTHTENTRSCYPLDFIANAQANGRGGTPRHVIMLTADAFGVMPPVARLSPDQAMYHFLSGYTARVAGTEKGMGAHPQATFSTCFGAPFLPRAPEIYGDLLGHYLRDSGATCWLVNTGWTGGAYGVGRRISLSHTRAILHAILDNSLNDAATRSDRYFRFSVPLSVAGIPDEILDPSAAWTDSDAYDVQARSLAGLFEQNFEQFATSVSESVRDEIIRGSPVKRAQ